MTLFAIQLALIFLPGIVWAFVDARYARKKQLSDLRLGVNAFVFGVVSYSLTYLAYRWCGLEFTTLAANGAGEDATLNVLDLSDEILAALAVSFASSIVWVYAENYKLFTRLLQVVRATKRYGDEDVWDYTFNSKSPSVEFVHVRDFAKKITYSGYVTAFSETDRLRELLLRDVDVTDFAGKLLYNMPQVYIARSPDDIHIEFPYTPPTSGVQTPSGVVQWLKNLKTRLGL